MANDIAARREKLILERILSLKQIIKEGEGGPLEVHELGNCYYLLRNYRQAIQYFDDLLEQYSDYIQLGAVHAMRIFCLIMEEDYNRAHDLLKGRLSVESQDTRLLAMLAFIHEKTGRKQEAVNTHRRILGIDPGNINSLNSLGYLLTLYGEGDDLLLAYECLKKAIARDPDNPAYLDSFGVFLARRGKDESARRAFVKALQRAPHNTVILDHLKELLEL